MIIFLINTVSRDEMQMSHLRDPFPSVDGYIMRMHFQFNLSVSWLVIFFHIFGQSALISLCLVSPGCKNLWVKQTVKPVATLTSAKKEINRGGNSSK